MKYKAVVMGASAGGMEAIHAILVNLKEDFEIPILITQHLSPHSDSYMATYLNRMCKVNVKEAEEKEKILPGNVYIAPPNYHLLLENDETLSLTVEPRVNYARPSIDVLFYSAADVYRNRLIGILLTGANSDGSSGLRRIKDFGGLTMVQDPTTAEASLMPQTAIDIVEVDYILPLDKITIKLIELIGGKDE